MPLAPGPYETLQLTDGTGVPFYILRFDAEGLSESPRTTDHLVAAVANGDYTDLILFSHGWNNDWATAMGRYRTFISGYGAMRAEHPPGLPGSFRPVLAGVIWPSTDLVLPWEKGPKFAGAGPTPDADAALEQVMLRDLASDVVPHQRARFYELATSDDLLADDEAKELLALVGQLEVRGDVDIADDSEVTVDDLLASWRAMPAEHADGSHEPPSGPIDWGTVGGSGEDADTPDAAGFFGALNPRNLIRMLTVRKMHDRAGVVGSRGVGEVLERILSASDVRVHLVGHSYGARVVMAAVSSDRPGLRTRPIASALLLQPAVSHLCFSPNLPGNANAGGFNVALERIVAPILTTYSEHDIALHDVFHRVFTREGDLGDLKIAGPPEVPPNRWAALGGYGPWGEGLSSERIEMKDPGETYDLGPGAPEVIGVNGTADGNDGSPRIGGHGDISNAHTYWALHNLIEG